MGDRRRRLGPSDTHPQQAAVRSFGKLARKDRADQRLDAFKTLSKEDEPEDRPKSSDERSQRTRQPFQCCRGGQIHAVRAEARPHPPDRHRKVSSGVACALAPACGALLLTSPRVW